MLNSLSIKVKLLSSTILAVVIILVLAGMNIYSIRQGSSALAEVYEKNVQPLALLQEMDSVLKEVRFRMVAVPLDQMSIKGSRDQLTEARARVPQIWAEFKGKLEHVQLDKDNRDLVDKIDTQVTSIDAFFLKLDGIYASNNKDALLAPLQEEWPLINRNLLKPIAQLIPAQEAAVKLTYERSSELGRKLTVLSLVVMAAGMAVLLAFAFRLVYVINRNIHSLNLALMEISTGNLSIIAKVEQHDELGAMAVSINQTVSKLNQMISSVKHAADDLAASSSGLSRETEKVSQRADVQSDRVMQVSAAMEEMSVSVSEISSGANNVASASNQTEVIAREGRDNMVKSQEATRKTVNSVESSSVVITELSHTIGKISEITKVIKDIADQTNLLALNAAIEAARAGEQGRGFAVVADEVRKLAERTTLSTSDITGMVETIHSKTGSSVQAMEDVKREVEASASYSSSTNKTLNQISEAAVQVTSLANQIASATREQSSASEEIASNMEAISTLTEENTVSIHNVGKEAGNMALTAAELQRLVGQFKLAN
ncbi:MAG TPA: methyl-accepting chemotaxis protein [Gallionellaceae bacterium]|nr:methyl-accepting chemotaxis protein [Gallionellaceae bacterium]HQS75657.1 methyl-accepting chemotaxis protein [Gallionellaceae bacterium]